LPFSPIFGPGETRVNHANCYSSLKRRLAEQHPDDIGAYMDGKDEFIKRMDAMAAEYYARPR
jgi:GrpB-like predicted nucleotidyltransferase (UPF0157 family)